MRALDLPQRFPLPHTMKDSTVATWVQWIREESNKLIAAIDEEITRRQDPDDPFDGTASGIFPPLQDIAGKQQTVVPKKKLNPIKIDESTNRNPQTAEGDTRKTGRCTESTTATSRLLTTKPTEGDTYTTGTGNSTSTNQRRVAKSNNRSRTTGRNINYSHFRVDTATSRGVAI